MIFLCGVWGTLTRKDPVEKNVGRVYLFNDEKEKVLKGYKTDTYVNGKSKSYEYPDIIQVKNELYEVSASPESENKFNIGYSRDYVGDVLYDVYDSDMNLVSDDVPELNISGNESEKFYVSASVVWGTEKENITMIYYFSIST